MVSILYRRQREERERRLERLSSARKAGALLSIISARSFCQQKKEQERLTLCEQRKQWKATQETKLKEIAEAINNAERNRMMAHMMAEVHRCNLHDMAKHEKRAWVGEKNLESARYALAAKTMEHDNNLRNASKRESRMYRMKSSLMEQTRLEKLKANHYHHPPFTIESVKSQFKQSNNIASSQNNLTRVHFVENDELLQPFNTEYSQKCYVNYSNTPYGSNKLLYQQLNELEEGYMKEMRESSVNDINNSKNDNDNDNNNDGVHTMMHVTPYSCKRRPVIDANNANSLHEANQGNTLSETSNIREEKRSSNVKYHKAETEKEELNTLCQESKLHEWHVITNGEQTKRENLEKRKTGLFDRNNFSVQSESEERRNQESVIEENTYSQKLLDEQGSKNSSLPTETDSYKNDKFYNREGYEHEQEIFSKPLAREHIKLHNTGINISDESKEVTVKNRAKEIKKSTANMEEDKSDPVDFEKDALERERAAAKAFREEFLLIHLTSPAIKSYLRRNCNDETDYSNDVEENSIIYLPVQTILSSAHMNDNIAADKEQANETEMASFTVQQLDFSSHNVEMLDEKLNSNLYDNNYMCDVRDIKMRNKHGKHITYIEQIRKCDSATETNKSQHCSIADNCNKNNILGSNKSNCLRNDTVDKSDLHVELKTSTRELTHLTCERNDEERTTDKRVQHDSHANNNNNNNNNSNKKHFTDTENNDESKLHIIDDPNNVITNVNERNTFDVINIDSTNLLLGKCKQKTECDVKYDQEMENSVIIQDVLTEKFIPNAIEGETTSDKELHKPKLNAPIAVKNNLYEKEMVNADINNELLPTASAKLAPTMFSLVSLSSTATEISVTSNSSSEPSPSSSSSEAVTTSNTSSTNTFLSSPATPYSEKMSYMPSSSSSSLSSHCSSSLTESSSLQSTSTSTNLLAFTSSNGQTMTAEQLRHALTQLRQKLLSHISFKYR